MSTVAATDMQNTTHFAYPSAVQCQCRGNFHLPVGTFTYKSDVTCSLALMDKM